MDSLPASVSRAYNDLADDPKYQHFVRIPDRILQCIDYFGITCDRVVTTERLHAYYLFIGVVDESIDSGQIQTGRLILDYLNATVPLFDGTVHQSRVKLVTEILKSQTDDETRPLMLKKLRQLYEAVVRERAATSIESYLEQRRSVGALTAEISYVLIRLGLCGEHEPLGRFMKQVGAIGCLLDSLIDLGADRRLGLLGFKPGVRDYTKLIVCILRDGLRVSFKHAGLSRLFVAAIVDNVQDRFRAERRPPPRLFVSDRKVEPASVA
jgi:hypothetical protein